MVVQYYPSLSVEASVVWPRKRWRVRGWHLRSRERGPRDKSPAAEPSGIYVSLGAF